VNRTKILIVSGEPSGDLHAANLVKDLKSLKPDLEFFGIGGDLSKAAGVDIVFDITTLALVGVVEVLRHMSTVKKAHDAVIARIDRERPDLAILVDYPGFNLKLAGDLAKRSIPVAYYISPQIWAWGRQRIHLIKKYVKKMVVFFKFEEELYKKYGVEAEFAGHPLLDVVKVTSPKADVLKKYGLSPDATTIALLPGSREFEVRTFLPVLARAAGLIDKKLRSVQFLISKHPNRPLSVYENALKGLDIDYRFVEGDLHNIVAASDLAIVASGTATLETAILGTPFILVYKANILTYALYKIVADIPFLCLANVIAGKEVAPELLQMNMTPEKISARTIDLLSDEYKLCAMREELAAVRASLGSPGASLRAARAILPLIQ